MRMFAGATSMMFVVAAMSAGCATGRKTTTDLSEKAAATAVAGAADAVIFINGLS